MKFAKELERELVPEWRSKYLNYKAGKKKIKYIQRAVHNPRSGVLNSSGSAHLGGAIRSALTPSASGRNFTSLPSHGSQLSFEQLPGPAIDPAIGATSGAKEARTTTGAVLPDITEDILGGRASVGDVPGYNDPTLPPPAELRRPKTREGQGTSLVETESKRPSRPPAPDLAARQQEFFEFVQLELDKVNTFYLSKVQGAEARMRVLRDQLHLMRAQRVEEVRDKAGASREEAAELARQNNGTRLADNSKVWSFIMGKQYLGKNTRALAQMETPSLAAQTPDPNGGRRDFERRQAPGNDNASVQYKDAKRMLKHALKEFYREMDLLRDYVNLNEKGFRKLNKKYNKIPGLPANQRTTNDNINNAAFVTSNRCNELMSGDRGVVDLYARYFNKNKPDGVLKKLRQPNSRTEDYSNHQFVTGVLLSGGLTLGILGLLNADKMLYGEETPRSLQVAYLLQIYGGFALVVYHALLFCFACMIWTKTKINYKFVLEFNTRHTLDWRQLLMFVSIFGFLLGLVVFLNFRVESDMFLYWPVLLTGLSILILFFPAPYLYHHARWWWAQKNFALFLPGIRRVFFPDFFLGDMYCSQTYTMGNIELFFCLYAHVFQQPTQCNSSHSRVLGFLTTLPSIIRALQCIRRYWDSKDVFPHIPNFCKYIFGIIYYMMLSLYRIEGDATKYRTPFTIFAFINAAYTSFWDVGMDWSMGSISAKPIFLRNDLAFDRIWVYYIAAVINFIIRFNWIAYAVYLPQIQHSSLLSFIVSLTEVTRRGIWTIFRVENEHCTNVRNVRAGRDVELPYAFLAPSPRIEALEGQDQAETSAVQADVEAVAGGQGVRQRKGSVGIGARVASAHARDFERKELPTSRSYNTIRYNETPSSDEEDDGNIEESDDEPESSARRPAARPTSMHRITE